MANAFDNYLAEINKAYLRGDDTEHTHRPALKTLMEALGKNITATNEPKRRTDCGAPDMLVSRQKRKLDQRIGYIECKDIGTDLKKEEKTEQIKKRYLPSLHNFILTNYIEFRWYTNGGLQETAILARESKSGAFKITEKGKQEVEELLQVFLEHEPEKIASAKELAIRLGHMARLLRDVTTKTFDQEEETGTLHGQFEAFREILLHDLESEQFADMYAQTICYGLFTAACYIGDTTIFGEDEYARFHGMKGKPEKFTRRDAAYLLPKTNPFLRKMFGHIAGLDLDDRIAWLVDDVVALLRECRMEIILRDFARKKGRRDPVVHFYETFLAEYDPKMRKKRGEYYTPDEVVSYIVRSIDILLEEKFGLKKGLSDDSKIKGKDLHRLLILDPAVGTGTFLFEVIDRIYYRFKRQKGAWSGYVREHLLPRLFGFELMMAPYAICHMKLGLELAETGYDFGSDERVGVYLTNTLEEAEEISRNVFVQWLSEEARAANKVKKDLPIMVVLGNPPYSGISANRGEWITRLIDSYRQINGQSLGEKKIWVKNDYVKFIRFGQHRIEKTGAGILAFITDHSYLDSPTFRGMRYNLLQSFNEIYLLNLHGNSKRREVTPDGKEDKNVFDIQQGVAISLFVKSPNKSERCIKYADLWGKRENKYKALLETDIKNTDWEKIEPVAPFYEFVPIDTRRKKEYEKWYRVNEIFHQGINGVQTSRDNLVVEVNINKLRDKIHRFTDSRLSDEKVRNEFFPKKTTTKYPAGDTRGWNLGEARRALQRNSAWENDILGYMYRPFDKRFILYNNIMVDWPRGDIMRHMQRENSALCVGRAGLVTSGSWDLIFCIREICDHNLFYRGSSFNMPLYLYPGDEQTNMNLENWPKGKEDRIPNLSREFVEELAENIGLKFVSDGIGDLKKSFGPRDVLGYIYGIFHSPEYRNRYAEFLKIDFPRMPMPPDKDMFVRICKIGQKLIKLHLLDEKIIEDEKSWPKYDIEGTDIVEKGYPKYIAHADEPKKGRVYINKNQCFEGVAPDVWEFHIGGYQVCEKWLKDRRERKLSYDDITHYQRITVALSETIRLMQSPGLLEMFEDKK